MGHVKRSLAAGAMTAVALVGVALPAGAAPSKSGSLSEPGSNRSDEVHQVQASGSLGSAIDAYACRSAGGTFGHGYVGARGYMEEIGATNVTAMQIVIRAQAKFTTAPYWRTLSGSAASYTYSFGGSPNSASHSLTGPRPNLVWSYNFDASDDANNYLYRMQLVFTWSNSSSTVTRTVNGSQCFSN